MTVSTEPCWLMRLSTMPEFSSGGAPQIPQELGRFLTALGLLALTIYALLVFSGAVLLAPDPPLVASAALGQTKKCAAKDNLASPVCGTRVRASSVDYRRSHYVSYVNDAEPRPDTREKWMPLRDDVHPWLEVILNNHFDLGYLLLSSSCAKEKSNLIGSQLRIVCYRDDDDALVSERTVRIDAANFKTPISCAKTTRLRLYFNRPLPHVYELSLFASSAEGS